MRDDVRSNVRFRRDLFVRQTVRIGIMREQRRNRLPGTRLGQHERLAGRQRGRARQQKRQRILAVIDRMRRGRQPTGEAQRGAAEVSRADGAQVIAIVAPDCDVIARKPAQQRRRLAHGRGRITASTWRTSASGDACR